MSQKQRSKALECLAKVKGMIDEVGCRERLILNNLKPTNVRDAKHQFDKLEFQMQAINIFFDLFDELEVTS